MYGSLNLIRSRHGRTGVTLYMTFGYGGIASPLSIELEARPGSICQSASSRIQTRALGPVPLAHILR